MSIFDEEINRFNTDSYKWDISNDELPMWVADMDFKTAPSVIEALEKRVKQGVFGYNIVPSEFNQSIMRWWKNQHDLAIEEEWVLFCTGVVPAISSIVRKLTEENDDIVVLSPVYNIFYNSIRNNNRNILASELLYVDGEYDIDYYDLEEILSRKSTSMLIFCNPHNPIGKIWDKETLERVGNLCVKHGVIIVSDEIHCDLTFPGKSYIPFLSVSNEITERLVMCCSPSKTFNLAGLQTGAIVVKNKALRQLVNRGINTDEVAEPNCFAVNSTIAAFNEGKQWLDQLKDYLSSNRVYIDTFLKEKIPDVKLIDSEATYLAWIDCSNVTTDGKQLCDFIRDKTGLFLTSGDVFGESGQTFIRLNYATNIDRVKDGLNRLLEGIDYYKLKYCEEI